MRNKLRFLVGMAFAATVLTSCDSNGYKVEGVTEGLADGDTLYVMSESPVPLDTLIVEDGKFEWKGSADSVYICTIVDPKSLSSVMFFREPGNIHILLSTNSTSEVSGTKSNDALQELNALQADFQAKSEKLFSQLNITEEVPEDKKAAIYEQYQNLQKEMGEGYKSLTYKHIDNELGYFLLTQLAYSDIYTKENLTDLIAKLPKKYRQREAVRDIERMMEASFSTEEGVTIPNFKMTSSDDNEVKIMDLVKNNKLTILDFWASWCQPCREEMPALKKLLADYQEKGLGIVGISVDDDAAAWKTAINELELSWPHISDLQGGTSNVAQSFGVRTIPFTAVIDQNGKVLAKGLRGEQLTLFIQEHLK